MQTPIKYALGLLAVVALVAPTTGAAVYSTSALGFHFVGNGQKNPATFNSCDYDDSSSVALSTIYYNVFYPSNSFPATAIRSDDNGTFNSCLYVASAEQGSTYIVVANGCGTLLGAPVPFPCPATFTKSAKTLGLFACFYDATGTLIGSCHSSYYAYGGDLSGTVPANAVQVLLGSAAGTNHVMAWYNVTY